MLRGLRTPIPPTMTIYPAPLYPPLNPSMVVRVIIRIESLYQYNTGADPANQVIGLMLEILRDHALLKLRTEAFLNRLDVMIFHG